MFGKKKRRVGVLGLGIIGSRVAANLRSKGFQTLVWNRSPKPEPNFLGSPAEVARQADILQIFVSDPDALRVTVAELLPALRSHHIILAHSTVGPECMREVAASVASAGAAFLDAPFTGSKEASDKGELTYYIGGEGSVLERARAVLEASSKAILPFGGIGDASAMKLATNMLIASTAEAIAEALALATTAGLSPSKLATAINSGATRSGVSDLKLPKMIAGDFEPHFSVKHMAKDVRLALDLAGKLGIDLPVARSAGRMLAEAEDAGRGDLDFASLCLRFPKGSFVETDDSGENELEAIVVEPSDAENSDTEVSPSEFPAGKDSMRAVPARPGCGTFVVLADQTELVLTGPDRYRYLNGQVTIAVSEKLPVSREHPACVLTGKGKLCALIRLRGAGYNTRLGRT